MRVETKIVWRGPEIKAEMRGKARNALWKAAEELLNRANKLVPHDEGTLQSSGEASVATGDMIAVVSYDTPYAVRLHEHPEYRFLKGREGKWLEKTMNESGGQVLDWLAEDLRF